ncbi:MAG: CO dehydrogenase/acetyl-CoA synthase subunit delta [Candidatus Methanomethylicia archaeon]|nr:CO dehydrogenase/acetyl-CoA synthase subunit delta [Candidatus Methanomethylicia archaeon]MCX8168917.1 CO dehydrogenase/acetyl-CoA synthase subunit delta [Candidatus Methanomethylicia archaeon]MDW7988649.1 CO dehydrogenase/acetyl-CoA synthase subunit delta [Nitrososphaerota archaeon]
MNKERKEETQEKTAMDNLLTMIMEAIEKGFIELHDVEIDVEEMEIKLQPVISKTLKPVIKKVEKAIVELSKITFEEPKIDFPGKIVEVKIGATKSEGGTRDRSIFIGGHTMPPYYYVYGYVSQNPPAFGGDIFDMRISLPRAVRQVFGDVLDNPIEWAKMWINEFKAEAINVHLVSTDPNIKDTCPSDSAKLIEEILQQVKVPIVVGGCGHPTKDVEVFKKVSDVAEGERIVLNSLNLDMKIEDICKHIAKKDTVVINFSPMDLDKAREINRKVYDWIPKSRIILDLNIGGIGYGTEYGFTAMERARLAALLGDEELQHPFNVGASNAWGAREAWITMDPYWGPREIRGPLWEVLTCTICLLAGADYFMILHPTTLKTLKELRENMFLQIKSITKDIIDWVSQKLPVI